MKKNAKIPSEVGGKTVTEIAWGAFGSLWKLESVTIPNSVKTIADEAFLNCTGLTTVSIGTGVKDLPGNPFDGCSSLSNIKVASNHKYLVVQDGVLFLKDGMKLRCYPAAKSGTTYALPDGVTEIGDSAFSGNTKLRTLVIPASVKKIHKTAFNNGYGQRQQITLDVSQNAYAKSYAIQNNMKYIEQPSATPTPKPTAEQGTNTEVGGVILRNGIQFGDSVSDVKRKENLTLKYEQADGIAAVWGIVNTTLRNVKNSTLNYCFNEKDELFQVYEYFNPNVSYSQGKKEYLTVQAELEAFLGKPLDKTKHPEVKTAGFDIDDYVKTVKAHKGDISITERDMWVIETGAHKVTVDHAGVLFGDKYKHYLFFIKMND